MPPLLYLQRVSVGCWQGLGIASMRHYNQATGEPLHTLTGFL